jgi:hypothetical protein
MNDMEKYIWKNKAKMNPQWIRHDAMNKTHLAQDRSSGGPK